MIVIAIAAFVWLLVRFEPDDPAPAAVAARPTASARS
jgi:hypothetical protein